MYFYSKLLAAPYCIVIYNNCTVIHFTVHKTGTVKLENFILLDFFVYFIIKSISALKLYFNIILYGFVL